MIYAHVPRKSTLEEAYEDPRPLEDHPPVNKINPKHYNNTSIEPIEVIEDWDLSFHLGNAIKYIKRAGQKDGNTFEEDIQKAIWYLNRSIQK